MTIICPFNIVVDVQEKSPWTFQGMMADADRKHQPIEVKTVWQSLGASRGDYSIFGLESEVGIERKSIEDAHGTILGWGERRDRFQRELETLASLPCSAVVLECTLADLVEQAPSHGVKSSAENAKILFRQTLAWQQDYRVPWVFCRGRRMAEIATFRILERYWRKKKYEQRVEKKVEQQLELI